MADDIVKQSSSNEAESDTQSTENTPSDQTQDPADKPNDRPIKTGNPDLDDVFKDAYPTDDGDYGYHYPGTKAELEDKLKDIPNAEQKTVGDNRTSTSLNDGIKVDVYPQRSSSPKDDPKPGWQIIKNGKKVYKGNTKQ